MAGKVTPAPGGFIDLGAIDPGVESLLTSQAARKASRAATPAARKKAQKDRARNRRSIDIPPALESSLAALADEMGVPFSNLVAYILATSLPYLDIAEIERARQFSRSMRYEYILEIPGVKRR